MSGKGWQAAFWLSLLVSAGLAVLVAAGCGGGSSTTTTTTKTTPTVSAWPTASAITYGQTLASSTLSGGTASVSGTFAWTISTLAPGAGTTSQGVTFTPADTTDYNTVAGTVSVTVNMATPTVTAWPTASAITYGQTLASSTLSGGTASVPGAFSWTTSTTAPATGTASQGVTFTPTDTTDYNTVAGTANVTVNKATPTVTAWPTASAITYGQTLASSTLSGGTASVVPGVFSWTTPTIVPSAGTPSESVTFTPTDTTDYSTVTGSVSVTVNAATPTVTVTPGSSSIPVNQSLSVTVTVSGGTGNLTPTGSVTLSGGGYTSAATALTSGSASITIPANSLAPGTITLTGSYAPDAASSSTYTSATGMGSVMVNAPVAYLLTVNSLAPAIGASITVSPNDNNGAGSGTTPFTRTYDSGTQVTLSAAPTDSGYTFVSWTGCTSASGANCSVTIGGATIVTATYDQPGITSIAVTPSSATIGTQQQFTATVHGTGSYSSGVTWTLTCPSCGSLSPGTLSASGLYNTPYPAPAMVTVTATSTMTGFTNVSGNATVTLSPPATATGPALAVDVDTPSNPSENPHMISPYVYGMNAYDLDPASEKIANPGILRWGGDDTSRYNYQNGWTNSASDYYFENGNGAAFMFPNSGTGENFTQFFPAVDAAGSASLGTVPVLGWVSNGTSGACSFTKSAYPGQQSYNGNCGNGVYPDGTNGCTSSSGCDIYGSNTIAAITSTQETPPSITSASTPPPGSSSSTLTAWADGTWSGAWVNSIVTNSSYGNGSSGKGVAIWDLDNEPTWWDAVHRDVHPVAFTYDEVTDNGIGTALAIKTADPTALVSGPVIDYWWAYFYSKKDIENGWSSGPCYEPWSGPIDREAHGGVPMIEYYLQQFNSYSQQYGIRLLDYVDIHGYFAPDYPAGSGNSVAFTTAGDTQEQEARMNGTRAFWDSTYKDPNYPQPNYITDSNYTTSCSPPAQAPQLIPMLQSWVAKDYPGTPTDPTKTAIDEYNFGGLESINGAVVQADILGIFGRQGLNMGAFWPATNYSAQGPGNYAFAMYRNYDGNDSTFGNTYLYATSTASGADAENQLAVYGAQRTADNMITIMVINKTYGSLTSTISLENFTAASGTTAEVYQYSNANLTAIVSQTPLSVTPPTGSGTTSTIASYTFPAQSITLFVIPG